MFNKKLAEKRAALVAENRTLLNTIAAEKREMTGEELEQFEKRMADIERITRQEDLERRQAETEAAESRDAGEGTNDPEFRNLGHFIHEVRFNRAAMESRAMSMGTGGEGGFNLPDQFRAELLAVDPESVIVRPRATVIPAGDPPDAKITMPALSQGANGAVAGVSVTWISEGDTKPETTPAFLEVSLEPYEVAGHIVVTDKLLRNWQASSAFISKIFREAIAITEDYAFLRGTGVGQPTGVIDNGNGAKILVTRAGATAVAFADVAGMLGRLLPDSWGRAVWVASITTLPKLLQMVDAGNASIFIQGDVTKGVQSTLFGLPIRFTGRLPVLGTAGDVILCDFSHYLVKDGSGPFVAASEHVNFTTNKTVVKAFWNVDGKPWDAAPLTLEDAATTVSPFVVLN